VKPIIITAVVFTQIIGEPISPILIYRHLTIDRSQLRVGVFIDCFGVFRVRIMLVSNGDGVVSNGDGVVSNGDGVVSNGDGVVCNGDGVVWCRVGDCE
jgi:hypothetical protein